MVIPGNMEYYTPDCRSHLRETEAKNLKDPEAITTQQGKTKLVIERVRKQQQNKK